MPLARAAAAVSDDDMVGESAPSDHTTETNSAADDSADEVEMRIVLPASAHSVAGVPSAADASDDSEPASSGADNTNEDSSSVDGQETRKTDGRCSRCPGKKAVKNCSNTACKRCCLVIGGDCDVHSLKSEPRSKERQPKVETSQLQVIESMRKARKPVLKNEFKESNITYYDETVSLFCIRDFFQVKNLSQSLLNDQSRSLRVNGSSTGHLSVRRKRTVKDATLKDRVADALGCKRRQHLVAG